MRQNVMQCLTICLLSTPLNPGTAGTLAEPSTEDPSNSRLVRSPFSLFSSCVRVSPTGTCGSVTDVGR